jgi:hypothetical protein
VAEEHPYMFLKPLMRDHESLESFIHAIDQQAARAKDKTTLVFLGMIRDSVRECYDLHGLSAKDALEEFL